MSELVSIDLHQCFYIPYGLKKRIKKTNFDLQDVLYDALSESDLKKNIRGEFDKTELSPEEMKRRNKLAMRIEIRYDTDREIEFTLKEVKMLCKLLTKPLTRDFVPLVIAQAIAYVEGTYDESLYFRDKYAKQPEATHKVLSQEKITEIISNLSMIGMTPADIIRAIIYENDSELKETPGKITAEFIDIIEPDEELETIELLDENDSEDENENEKPKEVG